MSRLSIFALLGSLLALVPACDVDGAGGIEVDSQEELGELNTGESGGDDDATGALLLGCGLEPACDALTLPGDEAAPADAAYDFDGLCVLEALTAERHELIQTVTLFDGSIANLDFAITGPGEALRQAYGISEGVGEWINPPMRCTLRGPEFFAACQVAFDRECLDPEAWVIGCEPVDTFLCPAAV